MVVVLPPSELDWADLVSIPLIMSAGGEVQLNAAAHRLLAGAHVVDEGGNSVDLPRLATDPSVDVVLVTTPGAEPRTFSCVHQSSPVRTVATLIDQTDLRNERAARVDAETMLDWTSELSGVGGWELDLTTTEPRWSKQVKRIHEVALHEQPGLGEAINFYAPDARPVITAALQRAMVDGSSWDLELPFVTARGRHVWVRAVGRAEFEEGQCRRLRGTFQDITSRRQVEQGYRRAAERARDFERVFQTAPTLQCIASLNGHFLALNGRWAETLGHSREEMLARPFLDFVHPDDLQKTQRATAALSAAEVPLISFENRYRRREGGYRWLRWYAISDLTAGKVYGIATDITDEKARALELQRLASVADRTENGVVVSDAEGRVLWVNPAFTRITGYEMTEMLGQVPGRVLQGEATDPTTVAQIRAALLARHGVQTELVNYRKDGSAFWVQLDIQPVFDDDGVLTNYVAIESDITARKEHEAGLRQARDAAEEAAHLAADANRAKSQFLANMSHEIRTPLNGVLGLADLLLDTTLDDRQRRYVETISRSGHALLTLLNDILDFSKIEANKLHLETAPFCVIEVVRWVTDMMRVSAEKRGLRMTLVAPSDIPALLGDEGRIRQVILNLVSNAIKFTEEGEITLVVEVDTAPQGVFIEVSVTDTGVGMSLETLERLFSPFTQADASTTRKFGGTGLGLSICKSLIELMGGRIGVESQLGEGSTFWFKLALAVAEHGLPAPTPPPHVDDLTGCRVLLVEDNPTNQLVAKGMLKRLGCEVEVADDGAAAVALAEQRLYDVILMDCQMPHMDGYTATRAIRKLAPPISEVPIIALTASTMSGDEDRCRQAGMTDYLAKPIRSETLAAKLGAHWLVDAPDTTASRPLPAL